MKILAVGFQRSGTTVLKRLMQQLPDVKHFFHELRLLKSHESKDDIARWLMHKKGTDIDKVHWGEKVPFYGKNEKQSINYCNKWNRLFLPDARIIHIVRHPLCVGISTIEFRPGKLKLNPSIEMHCNHIPKLITHLHENCDNVLQIKYEDLMQTPLEIMKKICKFCKLNPDIDHLFSQDDQDRITMGNQTIVAGRAFRYKTYPRLDDITVDVKDCIETINKYVEGVPYEVC